MAKRHVSVGPNTLPNEGDSRSPPT
jgi:hypothetical protein